MMRRKKLLYGSLTLVGAIVITSVIYINSLLPIITGYAAKNLCSGIFISERTQEDMESLDLNFSFIKLTKNIVDQDEMSVTSRFLWGRSEAIYREGFGVTLVRDITEEELRTALYPKGIDPGYSQDTIPWPMGDMIPDTVTGINRKGLADITERLIQDNRYGGNAFAFMVLHEGFPVTEAYKPRFDMDTRFLSWSMAKSVINALTGILVEEERIDIYQPADIEGWREDERHQITLNDLMQMQSGLQWNEDYGNRSDVTLMLHCEGDMSRFAYEKPLEHTPGTHWYYSSGTTNIVSYLLQEQFNSDTSYYAFIHNRLFNRTGMNDVVFETDPSGTIVGSSYLYATARDYARFALLYLNDGIFCGDTILPGGWVEYSRSENTASNGEYGSFFWLNKGGELPSAPDNMYMCVGHDGQRIFILPDQELIVIILGYSPTSAGGMDFDRLLGDILGTLQ